MTVVRLRSRKTFYLISSWVIILIGIGLFFYFMTHKMPEDNNEYILAFSVGYAGATILATYKVIGKDQAMDEIEELKELVSEERKNHAACQGRLDVYEKELNALRYMIMKHLSKSA